MDAGRHLHPAGARRARKRKLKDREGYGETSVHNLFAAIDARRENRTNRLIFALGIRHVGEGNAKLLARHYGSFDAFAKPCWLPRRAEDENPSEAYADLNNIGGIGDIVADAVVEFFAEKHNAEALTIC